MAAPFLIARFLCVTFSCGCSEMPDKSNLGVGSGLQVKGWTIMARKPWRQEHEATGHIAWPVRKQSGLNAGVQLALPFLFSPGCPLAV